MKDNCSKHPVNVGEYTSPEELAEDIGKSNYFFQERLYKRLIEVYKRQSIRDSELKNKQLSSNLEELSKAFESPVVKAIKKVCKTCKKYLNDPFSSQGD